MIYKFSEYMSFMSKKILTILAGGLVLSSCATGPQMARELPVTKHSYSKSKHEAYKKFGFDYDSTPKGIFNTVNKKPTEFDVHVYIGENQDCKFIYTSTMDEGTESFADTKAFKAYLNGHNTLLELRCKGNDSNIDYKVEAYANGIEYDNIGNLSYLVEAGELE